MRSFFALLLTLIALSLYTPLSFAQEKVENFNQYHDLTLDFSLSSSVTIAPTSSIWEITDLKADLSFFPQTAQDQQVLGITYQSTPTATVSADGTTIHYVWPSVSSSSVSYGVKAQVTTTTALPQITGKVQFPIKELPPEYLEDTQETEFIDITPEIEAQARAIAAGKTDMYEIVHDIAEWTKNNVEYDLSTLTATAVQKSSWVLANKKGVCDEITNLFISMLRSLGIPAIFVSGMVYSNLDYEWGPHGWAEVYFPGYGWVPYDVTFGQFGWLDPSHLKLKEDVDSGASSAEYTWNARDAELTVGKTNIATTLLQTGSTEQQRVDLIIEPERASVGMGSYVPLIVTITNKQNFYLSSQVVITKAPKLTSSNVREISLAPYETKKLVWIAEIPADVAPGYIYTSTVEADANFAIPSEGKLQYGVDEEVYTREAAQAFAETLNKKEEKEQLQDIFLACKPDKQKYYAHEQAQITCTIKNTGGSLLEGTFCIGKACQAIRVSAGRTETVTLPVVAEKTGRQTATVESGDKIAYQLFDLITADVPKVEIVGVAPQTAPYKELVQMKLTLTTTSPITDVTMDVGFGQVNFDEIKKEQTIQLQVPARALVDGLDAEMVYRDALGKVYQQTVNIPFTVTNIPWYIKPFLWVKRIF